MTHFKSAKKPVPVGLSLGILGGAALIITTLFTTNGFAIFLPYAALPIATFAALRALQWSSISKRFVTSLLTFMVATIILYLFIGIFDAGTILEISVWGHLWRLGLMAAIGAALSFAVAYLVDVGRSQVA